MVKLLLFPLGFIGILTVVVVRQSDPATPITRQMEQKHGSVANVSVLEMTTWFTQHQGFATQIAQECAYSPHQKQNIRWAETTEGHICRAAIPVAAYASLTTEWPHN